VALTKVTGQVINDTTGLVVGVTTVGGGLSATDGFFSGIVTAVGDASFSGNVSVGGTLTYEDVTNIDAVGLITARNGVVVGSGITLSKDGDGFFTGVVTATSYAGDGSGLTGIAATDNVRTGILDVAGVGTFRNDVNVPDKIIHLGDTDTAIRFPSADNISFEVAGTERLRIDDSDGVIAKHTTAANLRVQNSTAATSQVAQLDLAPANGLSGVQLKATSEEDFSTGANRTAFFTVDVRKDGTFSERFKIASGGDVTVSTGNLIIGTAGQGIDFSATGEGINSSSMSSEVLDDYEEGSWTPQIHTQNGNSNASYDYQTGYYTKIGNRVFVNFSIMWSGATNHSGYIYVNNFPYSSGNVTHNNNVGTIMTYDLPFSGSRTDIVLYMGSNASGTNIYFSGNNASWDPGQNATGGRILGSMQYLSY